MHDAPADRLPLLAGHRTRLRGIEDGDFDDYYALHADPRVMRYWSFPPWTHPDQAATPFATARSGRNPDRLLCWAIDAGDGRLVGTVTLYAIERPHQRACIGYALHAGHWGRGLATEAVALALQHGFGTLGLHRVEADIDPRNHASCRLAERLGFTREGLVRERWYVAGERCDTALYGLLAHEWRVAQAVGA